VTRIDETYISPYVCSLTRIERQTVEVGRGRQGVCSHTRPCEQVIDPNVLGQENLPDGVGAVACTSKHREELVRSRSFFPRGGRRVIHDDAVERAVQRVIDGDTAWFHTYDLCPELDGVLYQEAPGLCDDFAPVKTVCFDRLVDFDRDGQDRLEIFGRKPTADVEQGWGVSIFLDDRECPARLGDRERMSIGRVCKRSYVKTYPYYFEAENFRLTCKFVPFVFIRTKFITHRAPGFWIVRLDAEDQVHVECTLTEHFLDFADAVERRSTNPTLGDTLDVFRALTRIGVDDVLCSRLNLVKDKIHFGWTGTIECRAATEERLDHKRVRTAFHGVKRPYGRKHVGP